MKNKPFACLIILILTCSVLAEPNKPENIIIMIGDGMGFEHIQAYEIYSGTKSPFNNFKVKLAMTTFPAGQNYDPNRTAAEPNYVASGYTDSAAAATAMACGIKTANRAIGVDANFSPVENIFEFAESKGKSTGVVSTVAFSHATPAAFSVHNKSRNNYHKIADDMIRQSPLDVIIAPGHPMYDDDGEKKDSGSFKFISPKTFKQLKKNKLKGSKENWHYAEDVNNYCDSSAQMPDRLFVLLPVGSTLQQKRSGAETTDAFETEQTKSLPDLGQTSAAALNVLQKDKDGFCLMIEGGAIDWACHSNQDGRMLEEMTDFNNAVKAVVKWCRDNDKTKNTLLIVTADHETGYLSAQKMRNGLAMKWRSKSHTNLPVPFYAAGPGAETFEKYADQTDPSYGKYIDNTEIAEVIFKLLGKTKKGCSASQSRCIGIEARISRNKSK